MHEQIAIIFRHPDQIRQAVEAGRKLCEHGERPVIVFLCPECDSHLVCKSFESDRKDDAMECITDRCENCAPSGFRCLDADQIARMIRRSDIVIPL